MIKFSIITVTYNAAEVVERTIRTVVTQSYNNLEYIIVDGSSTDGTLDIIKKYASGDERIRYISEPDSGIYDAMNKGIRMATGDYLEFLNAGDLYRDDKVLLDVAGILGRGLNTLDIDILYGSIIYVYPDGDERIRTYSQFCEKKLYYLLGDCINHQAMFAARRCFENAVFNTSYRISADREWMIRQKKAGRKFRAIDRIICYYSLDPDSASIANEKLTWKENGAIIRKHLILGYPVYLLVNAFRRGKITSRILHKVYEMVFIRDTSSEQTRFP